MSEARALDERWLASHPLPGFADAVDKSSRGQALVVGGGPHAPAAPRLTAEAALRAGCGRVRVGVAATMVPHLAAYLPEAGFVALPADAAGAIGPDAAETLAESVARADAMAIGPGMNDREAASALTARLLAIGGAPALLLDCAACAGAGPLRASIAARGGRVVLTPHPGEMAQLTDRDPVEIESDPAAAARAAARTFNAVVALRSAETWIAAPDGRLLHYPGGGIGLATGGSGDVGVGIILGLLARGAEPLVAAAWGTWAHGEAGRALGAPGFLAGDMLPLIRDLLQPPEQA